MEQYTQEEIQKVLDDAERTMRLAHEALDTLKKERDELKEAVAILHLELHQAPTSYSEIRQAEQSALAERNEAREDEEHWRKAYEEIKAGQDMWDVERG